MRRDLAICAGLVVITLAAYWQAPWLGFVNFDDPAYVESNTRIANGLTWENVVWAFSTTQQANWHPITWMSYLLDGQFFGINSTQQHIMNVVLHVANSILLYLVLRWMTAAPWPSALVAALFAVHPLHVESVAWVSERKDVLSTLCGFSVLLAYVYYVRRPSLARYAIVFALLAIGLMAKPMLVTLPCILLLLDYWPLRRLRFSASKIDDRLSSFLPVIAPCPISWLIIEKLPLAVLSVASSIITFLAQKQGGAMEAVEQMSFGVRLENALLSYGIYLWKMLWPVNLAALYPFERTRDFTYVFLAAGIILTLSLAVIWGTWRGHAYLAVGWLWYLGTLAPVIGLVQVGGQAMADRYTYIPSVGIFIIIAFGAVSLIKWLPTLRNAMALLAAIVLSALVVMTARQVGYWANSEAIWRHTLKVAKESAPAHIGLGGALDEQGRTKEVIVEYHKALQIDPQNTVAHIGLAQKLIAQGNLNEARSHYEKVLEIDQKDLLANLGMAKILFACGKTQEAAGHYRAALRADPGMYLMVLLMKTANSQMSLGCELEGCGMAAEAIHCYQTALQMKPHYAEAQNNLGRLLAMQGRIDEAAVELEKAVSNKPDFADAHSNLGNIWLVRGRLDKAMFEYQNALRINPDLVDAHNNLAHLLIMRGQLDEAIMQYLEVLRLRPDSPDVLNQLARIYATATDKRHRNGAEALRLAQRGCALTNRKDPAFLDTLAAAYAEVGQFSEAFATASEAANLASSSGKSELAKMIRVRLQLYQNEMPYREPPNR
jgi:protein O-mannosyl-transferase